MRLYLVDRFSSLWNEGIAALALGMLIGDRSLFLKEDYQTFIDGGLVHLVAVSGGNIALIVALFGALLFFVPFRIRVCIVIAIVIVYAYLVGVDSSVLRATVMATLTLLALLPGRPLSIWRMLAYARIALLLFNPYYLFYDLGFLLSFGAVVGILWSDMILHRLVQTWKGLVHSHDQSQL